MRRKKEEKNQFSTDLIAADKSLPFADDLRRNETRIMKTIAFFFFLYFRHRDCVQPFVKRKNRKRKSEGKTTRKGVIEFLRSTLRLRLV